MRLHRARPCYHNTCRVGHPWEHIPPRPASSQNLATLLVLVSHFPSSMLLCESIDRGNEIEHEDSRPIILPGSLLTQNLSIVRSTMPSRVTPIRRSLESNNKNVRAQCLLQLPTSQPVPGRLDPRKPCWLDFFDCGFSTDKIMPRPSTSTTVAKSISISSRTCENSGDITDRSIPSKPTSDQSPNQAK